MNQALIVHGRYARRKFIPDEPMPDTEGKAELVIIPTVPKIAMSITDAFGKASQLRSGDEILAQVRIERDEWEQR
ncbi:MAG: hypothetical protein JNJ77_09775 [Planctomycetia bacterium]|nr:hypothetical protein [Planctomycetia bacterium]